MGLRDFIKSKRKGGREKPGAEEQDATSSASAVQVTATPSVVPPPIQAQVGVEPSDPTTLSTEALVSNWQLDLANLSWQCPDPRIGNNTITHSGALLVNFDNDQLWHWAFGRDTVSNGPSQRLFPATHHVSGSQTSTTTVDFQDYAKVPHFLLDLHTGKVVASHSIPKPWSFAFISHVCGGTLTEIDGSQYGLEHSFLIRDAQKLDLIMQYAKIVTGERYIWIDALCQNAGDLAREMSRMHDYLSSASGCLVWLDDTRLPAGHWSQVLRAIEYINGTCGLDRSGRPKSKTTPSQFMVDSGHLQGSASALYLTMLHILNLEKAEWFHRVWTLQESIVPDNVFFVTPERYMLAGWTLMHAISRMGIAATTSLAELSEKCWSVMLSQCLAQSETWKIACLRKSLRRHGSSPEKVRAYLPLLHILQAIKTRRARNEQDRCFGTAALHPVGLIMGFSYEYSAKGLLGDAYTSHVKSSDFSTLLWVGDAANICSPDYTRTTPLVFEAALEEAGPNRSYITELSLTEDRIILKQAGLTNIEGWQYVYSNDATPFPDPFAGSAAPHMDMPSEIQMQLARAFGMNDRSITIGDIGQAVGQTYSLEESAVRMYPAVWAIVEFLSCLKMGDLTGDQMADKFGQTSETMQAYDMIKGWMLFLSALQLMGQHKGYAIVAVWDRINGAQLAVISRPIGAQAAMLMPVGPQPGGADGCLICAVDQDGNLSKLGVGLGRALEAEKLLDRVILQ